MTEPSTRAGRAAWCMYDWANSAFPTVIITFVFAAYFTEGVVGDAVAGTAMWGQAMGYSAFAIVILAPILGAIADHTGRRKPWLFLTTGLCIVLSACLWIVTPDASMAITALLLVAGANIAFELGMVFYNAMLPDLVGPKKIGRMSGWGWATGYFGGLVCLALVLVLFVQADSPIFGLDKDAAEHVRIVGPFVALWMALFAIPLFILTPDKPTTGVSMGTAVRRGFRELSQTIAEAKYHKNIFKFLIARMFYTDGLNTLFAFGGIYAAGTFGMSFEELIIFGIGMNVTAGLGAFAFAWFDDRWGSKTVIYVSLVYLIILGTAILIVEDVTWFWVFGLSLGIFVGPAQSASRTLMARISPEDIRTEMFGLYALSGKATAFLGPLAVGILTYAFDSQRVGMSAIVFFFILGGLLMIGVKQAKGPLKERRAPAG